LVGPWRQAGGRIALVPTMGALHEGHLSLVRQARQQAERVVVSIFVNPAQFAPHEDFSSYPRQLQRDLDLLQTVGIDAVFTPDAAVMYPAGFATTISMTGPAAAGLEDASRPVFFHGVATVVAKLLVQVAPDLAIFGEKDFQQLAVIRQMTADLNIPVEILGAPTMREADGLAAGVPNREFTPSQRLEALALSKALKRAKEMADSGVRSPDRLIAEATHIMGQHRRVRVIYVAIVDSQTMETLREVIPGRSLLAISAWIDEVRLIDNVEL